MTKRTLVLLPLFIIALVAVGCAGDHGGSGSKAKSSFVAVDTDPVAEGLARGYISTVVTDLRAAPNLSAQATNNSMSYEPSNRNLFQSQNVQAQALSGQVGISTLVPKRTSQMDPRFDPNKISATRGSNDMIVVKAGEQQAMISHAEINGQRHTVSLGADGVAVPGGNSTFPQIVDVQGVGQGVHLMDGQLVPVK